MWEYTRYPGSRGSRALRRLLRKVYLGKTFSSHSCWRPNLCFFTDNAKHRWRKRNFLLFYQHQQNGEKAYDDETGKYKSMRSLIVLVLCCTLFLDADPNSKKKSLADVVKGIEYTDVSATCLSKYQWDVMERPGSLSSTIDWIIQHHVDNDHENLWDETPTSAIVPFIYFSFCFSAGRNNVGKNIEGSNCSLSHEWTRNEPCTTIR